MLKLFTKIPVQLYLLFVLGYFLTTADNYLFLNGAVSLPPIRAFILMFAPVLGLLLVMELLSPKPLVKMLALYRENAGVILLFSLMLCATLLWALHPTAYWAGGGKWVKAIFYDFFFFMTALTLCLLPEMRKNYRSILLVSLLVLFFSIAYDMFNPGTFSRTASRAAGLASNANLASLVLVMIASAVITYDPRRRMFDLSVLAITGIGVFVTLSRGGIVIFALLAAIYLYSVFFTQRSNARQGAIILLAGTLIGGAVLLIVPQLIQESEMFEKRLAQERLAIILGQKQLYTSDDSRVHAAMESLRLINDAPLLGHGTGFSHTMEVAPHNMYLLQWIDGGFVGLILYLGLLGAAFVIFHRRRFTAGKAFVGVIFVSGIFSHNIMEHRPFLMLLGILLGVSTYNQHRQFASMLRSKSRRFLPSQRGTLSSPQAFPTPTQGYPQRKSVQNKKSRY